MLFSYNYRISFLVKCIKCCMDWKNGMGAQLSALLWFCSFLLTHVLSVIYNPGNLKLCSGPLIVSKEDLMQFSQCLSGVLIYWGFQALNLGITR